MFEDHFREKNPLKNVIPYCYFSLSFYLVEIGKVPQAVKLLKRMESFLNEKSDNKIKALTYYNLGILQYALGEFKIGIHNIEIAYKKIVEFFCLKNSSIR
jgi:tetratricopeptide (TPR) repeat protein